ncbi:MAG: response regulator transcription factor [Peptostreptococcaceae bacterium]|nr:response regulator transcription factor [Peptostreptococcaceae bacterium]
MKIIVIDDERPARSELIHLLKEIVPNASISEADNGATALELISKNVYDTVFIDINLGDINGTSLALAVQQILPKANIIFATAFSEYAVKAFEIGVSNYILKPFSKDQLNKIIAKCQLELTDPQTAPVLSKMPINCNRRVVMVDIDKIVFIETDNRGCMVHTQEGDFRENLPIGEYERKLSLHRFYRIHKCFIVNLDQIHEIIPWHNNCVALKMFGYEEKVIPVARNNTKELKQSLGI